LPKSIFSTLKNKRVKTRKIPNILKTAGNIAKSSTFQAKALLLGVLHGVIFGFKFYRKKYFCSKFTAIFKSVKINFGSKFGAWVSFQTDILQSRKFKENLGRTVVVLPLLDKCNLRFGCRNAFL